MANHYYGVTVPGPGVVGSVTVGTSTTSKNVELVVLDGVTGRSKEQLLLAIEAIEAYIITHDAPA